MGKSRRLKRERREARHELIRRLDARGIGQNMPLIRRHGMGKISEALRVLIEPYTEESYGLDARRRLVQIGALAWNAALSPQLLLSRESLRETLGDIDESTVDVLHATLEILKRRKLELFPEDQRLIMEAEVTERSDGTYYLTAVAAMGKP